jgi:tRNA A-37 threonylcarbamoyl transferase component Bud32
MSDEIPLGGGAMTEGVVRVGDTVRRPSEMPRLARDVLHHLERAGFDAAPRWLGVDEQRREILTWIDGETFTDRSQMHPYIGDPLDRVTFSDDQIGTAMRLLRRYHDAFGEEVICHGDFGPWNLVWRERLPIGIIDFDNVYRGESADDVAYALRMFVSYGFTASDPIQLVRRTKAAMVAYGRRFDVPMILDHEYDLAEERCRRNGWDRQLARLPLERAWLAANRSLF